MSERQRAIIGQPHAEAPVPVLTILDAEPVGFCEPGSGYCEVSGLHPEAPASGVVQGSAEVYNRLDELSRQPES